MLALSYAVGTVPVAGIAARVVAGVDLRHHGTGTVSGTGLYEVAGFVPLAVAGCAEVAGGTLGPLLAGRERPWLVALAAGAAVAGHNWSPWLGGAGGRGVSPSLGALLVAAPEGAATLVAGLAVGRLLRQTGLGVLVATVALVPLLGRRRGPAGLALGLCVLVPMVAKRLVGNGSGNRGGGCAGALARLLFDRETRPTDDLSSVVSAGARHRPSGEGC